MLNLKILILKGTIIKLKEEKSSYKKIKMKVKQKMKTLNLIKIKIKKIIPNFPTL